MLLSTRSRYIKALQAKFEVYADAHARYSEAVAEREVLAAAVTQVAQVLDAYQTQWLGRLDQGLEAVMGPGGRFGSGRWYLRRLTRSTAILWMRLCAPGLPWRAAMKLTPWRC